MRSRTSQPILRDKPQMTLVLMLFQFYYGVGLRLYSSASTDSTGSIVRQLDDRRIGYVASEMRNGLEEPAQSERYLCQ